MNTPKAITEAQAITDPTTATPVQIDTALEQLDGVLQQHYAVLANKNATHLHDQARAIVDAATAEFNRLDAEHDRRKWTRYLTVAGGHIHAEYRCAGLKWNTRRNWHPQMSGTLLAAAITRLGETMCSHCFPGAPVADKPVNPDHCPGSGKQANRAAGAHSLRTVSKWATCPDCGQRITVSSLWNYRTHDTREAAARKLAEQATAAGKIVVDGELKTPRAVQMAAVEHAYDARVYSHNQPEFDKAIAQRDQLIRLLAAHTDTPPAQVLATITAKANAKFNHDYR